MKMVAPMEIGICCRDLESLRRFYVDTLGFEAVNDLQVPPEKSTPASLAADGYRVARLQSPWGERIKLLQPVEAASERESESDWVLARQGKIYLTFIVDDLKAMIAKLRASDVRFLTGAEPFEVRPQTFLCFLRDPEGNVLEFVEYGDIKDYRSDLQ